MAYNSTMTGAEVQSALDRSQTFVTANVFGMDFPTLSTLQEGNYISTSSTTYEDYYKAVALWLNDQITDSGLYQGYCQSPMIGICQVMASANKNTDGSPKTMYGFAIPTNDGYPVYFGYNNSTWYYVYGGRVAQQDYNGIMSAEDKTKLDNMALDVSAMFTSSATTITGLSNILDPNVRIYATIDSAMHDVFRGHMTSVDRHAIYYNDIDNSGNMVTTSVAFTIDDDGTITKQLNGEQ